MEQDLGLVPKVCLGGNISSRVENSGYGMKDEIKKIR